jgi:uracil-DNA glycosylase
LLDKALAEARIPREQVYVTNAVKHFKWIWRANDVFIRSPRSDK